MEAAVREQARGVAVPTQALLAAAELGEHQALRAQITALSTQRDRLLEDLVTLTYKVAELETRLQERTRAQVAEIAETDRVLSRLRDVLEQTHTSHPVPRDA